MKLHLRKYKLELKHPFRISRYVITDQPTLIVGLEQDGQIGYGECTASRYYGTNVEEMYDFLEGMRGEIESFEFDTPEKMWSALESQLIDNSFVQCALDEAAHDLYGKLIGKPVWELLGLKQENLPISNYTIGIGSPEEVCKRIREHPWPVYKIKLGTEMDLEVIKKVREETQVPLRVDANSAWTVEKTLEMGEELKKLGVEFIEQPLPYDDWEGMEKIKNLGCALPIIADESMRKLGDLERCADYFNGINIKLMKCGGITPALKIIEASKETDLRIMAGCMTESSVGISALAQLLPLLEIVDMDGAILLKRDIAEGVKLEEGRAIFPERNGTGVVLKKGIKFVTTQV